MKESNTLANNATNNFLGRDFWINMKGQYMKGSDTFKVKVANKFHKRFKLLDIIGLHKKPIQHIYKQAGVSCAKFEVDLSLFEVDRVCRDNIFGRLYFGHDNMPPSVISLILHFTTKFPTKI